MAYSTQIKEQLDVRLLPRPGVTSREMFGGVCYLHNSKMFVIITGDSVVTKLPETERQDALKNHGATEFIVSGRKTFGQWTQFHELSPSRLEPVMFWIDRGMDYVKSSPAPLRRKRSVKTR